MNEGWVCQCFENQLLYRTVPSFFASIILHRSQAR